jgi:uncharacterized membrane protein
MIACCHFCPGGIATQARARASFLSYRGAAGGRPLPGRESVKFKMLQAPLTRSNSRSFSKCRSDKMKLDQSNDGPMRIEQSPDATPEALTKPSWPGYPTSSSEFITLIAHYYRAEMARMAGWRDRIDRTSNWAITVVGAMLSVSLSTPTSHHGLMLFAMVLVLLLLVIESRRYRFFDVYRARVRRLERYYYAQVFARTKEIENDWTHTLSDDLKSPLFLIGRHEAISRRMRRNYCWMFLILLLAWLLKITTPHLKPDSTPVSFVPSSQCGDRSLAWLDRDHCCRILLWLGAVRGAPSLQK